MGLNAVAMIADAMMIIQLSRTPTSYFRPYRGYFTTIYLLFLAFPARELALMLYPAEWLLRVSTLVFIASAVCIAVLWGHLATRLYVHPSEFSILSIFKLTRRIHFLFILYLVPLVVTLTFSLIVPGAVDANPSHMATYLLSQTSYRVVTFSSTFLSIASSVIVAFVLYPFAVLTSLRSELRDVEVRSALRIIATSFGIISGLILVVNALDNFGLSLTGPSHLVAVALLIIVVRAFSKTSFLKSFLGLSPSMETRSGLRRPDQKVALYANDSEKLGPIAHYVEEGLAQEARITFFYRGPEATIREGLARQGLNVRQLMTKGELRLVPTENLYEDDGPADEGGAIEFCQGLAKEAKTVGKKGLRIVIDYGDYFRKPWARFMDHLTDPRWTSSDHFVKTLILFDRNSFQGQQGALDLLDTKMSVVDLAEGIEAFSRRVGLSHPEIAGRKILLEYDPISDYDKVIGSVLTESASNLERTVVFSRKDSPLYPFLEEQPGLKIFNLTSKVSYPRIEEEDRVLLPAYDTSLMLDALSRVIEAYGSALTVIFDSISHYIFTMSIDRALSLVRQSLELMISNRITVVFLMNLGAHDQTTLSTFESLFDMEIVCRPGTRIPEVRKKIALPV